VNLVTVIPMAFVMIAGPQILSAIFLATSEQWRRNSAAYVFGAALSITLFITLAYFLGNGARSGGGASDTIYWIILALLLVAMLRTYLKRGESEPPKWMSKLLTARPRFAFALGFLLLGVFPTDILTSVAVGSYLGNKDDPVWHAWIFVAFTLLLLALPALLLLVFRERGQAFLPKAREWMTTNSWVVNELVLLLFVAIVIGNLT
jgi:threonine/homoserine/homoserine lactone efflux protein